MDKGDREFLLVVDIEVEVGKELQTDNAVACTDPENSFRGVLTTLFLKSQT